jgi:Domain of unknown function (DUF4123)
MRRRAPGDGMTVFAATTGRTAAAALEAIYGGPGNAYAVLDAARSRRVLRLVRERGECARILYEGPVAPDIAEVAPYLVVAGRGSGVAEEIVSLGWGDAWGIFCASTAGPDELRRHLRRFLTVRTEKRKNFLFRFYDPRVLRVYLPTCTPEELKTFFGPVERFVCEGERSRTAVVHRRAGDQLRAEEIPLGEPAC